MWWKSKSDPGDKGKAYEKLAADFISRRGLDILEHNFCCRFGEIDIIARDGEHIVFIEVKYRKSAEFGHSLEMVSRQKQKKLVAAAKYYLSRLSCTPYCRFDVIAIGGSDNQIDWITNAFITE